MKIAVVEDEATLQNVLTEWLSSSGYEAFGITTGSEALQRIPRELPDLVLLDLILPEVNGFEVLSELQKNPSTAKIPVVILSNLGGEADRDRALKLGAKAFLVKSENDFPSILKIIKQFLGQAL